MDGDALIRGGAPVNLWGGLFADGGDADGQPLGARRIQEEERKAAVAGDEAKFHGYLMTPRSLRSKKETSTAASSPSSSLIFSRACVVFSLAASSSRKAFCNFCNRSGEKPRRVRPTLLMPNALFSRREEVSEKGSTSWVTMVPPPMNAYWPTMQCW